MHDCHTHSLYSEDVDKQRGSSIDAMAARALEIGLASIAITDHLEIDNVGSPLHEPLDSDGIRRDVMAAKEKYAGRLNVIYGLKSTDTNTLSAQRTPCATDRCFQAPISLTAKAMHS